MHFGTAFLLITLNQAFAQIIPRPDSECDFRHTVRFGQKLHINNPRWPSTYKQNRICRWIVDCPSGFICHLKCKDVALPQSDGCSEDKLLVSTLGSNWLVGADKYCGRTYIDAKSINYRLTIGLIASSKSPGGRFRCLMVMGEVYNIENPRWPARYVAGTTCRWMIYCPPGNIIRIRCGFLALPRTPGCSLDKLYISKTGDAKFRRATAYCGHKVINVRSNRTKLALGLVTSKESPGGRFTCAVRTEPALIYVRNNLVPSSKIQRNPKKLNKKGAKNLLTNTITNATTEYVLEELRSPLPTRPKDVLAEAFR